MPSTRASSAWRWTTSTSTSSPVPAHDRYVETWKAFIELRDEGLIRAIGVSNFQPAHLERLIAETGETPAINQVELHPYLQQQGLRHEHDELGTPAGGPVRTRTRSCVPDCALTT